MLAKQENSAASLPGSLRADVGGRRCSGIAIVIYELLWLTDNTPVFFEAHGIKTRPLSDGLANTKVQTDRNRILYRKRIHASQQSSETDLAVEAKPGKESQRAWTAAIH